MNDVKEHSFTMIKCLVLKYFGGSIKDKGKESIDPFAKALFFTLGQVCLLSMKLNLFVIQWNHVNVYLAWKMILTQHMKVLYDSDKNKTSCMVQISYCSVNSRDTVLAQIKFPCVVRSWLKFIFSLIFTLYKIAINNWNVLAVHDTVFCLHDCNLDDFHMLRQ